MNAGLIEDPIRHLARSLELTRELTRETTDRPALMAAIVRYANAINMSGRIAESAALLEPASDEYRDLLETPIRPARRRACADLPADRSRPRRPPDHR